MFSKWIDERGQGEWGNGSHDNSVVSVRQWVFAIVVMLMPVVNLVMLFWWAFSDKETTPVNRINWARAAIIVLSVTLIVLSLVVGCLFLILYV